MTKLIITLSLFTIASCVVNKGTSDESHSSKDAELINYLFEDATGNRPGASYSVIKNGKIIDQNSFGLSHVGKKIKSTPETNYRIASVAKQFTAMAIMILENKGKLSYETKLTEIFPDFPNYGKNINVRYLLTHQSGLVDYDEFIIEDRTEQMLDAEVLKGLIKIDSTYFFPGSQYRYSNSGYAVLALIVEKISGGTFADFMAKEIFDKLNMSDTQVFELDESIKNRAYGYSIENDSIILNDQSVTSTIQGDGGIYSNVLDYFKWDQALYTDKLIPLEKLKEAFYDYNNNEKTMEEGYGFGWTIDYHNGTKILDHSGGTAGFESWVKRIPSLNLSVVIFTNRDGHDRHLMHRINGLISIYSDYYIPLPLEIIMKKEIDQKGIIWGVEIYDKLKGNARYRKDTTTLIYLGFEYYRKQEFDNAKELFIKATKEYPDYFGGYYGLGVLNIKLENFDLAIINFQKVIEFGTGDEPWMLDRAKKHLNKIINEKTVPNKD